MEDENDTDKKLGLLLLAFYLNLILLFLAAIGILIFK